MTMLDILNEIRMSKAAKADHFTFEDLNTKEFRTRYGEYLLGEIKDALSFYYDELEFGMFMHFFSYLNGDSRFDYDTFTKAFHEYSLFLKGEGIDRPGFMRTADEFLQFLYDQNILNYVEIASDEKFIRWCFRERNLTNISPKIKTGATYEIHYGLANTLNTGKSVQAPVSKKETSEGKDKILAGRVKRVYFDKGYGFIEMDDIPIDIYFRLTRALKGANIRTRSRINFTLVKTNEGRLRAENVSVNTK